MVEIEISRDVYAALVVFALKSDPSPKRRFLRSEIRESIGRYLENDLNFPSIEVEGIKKAISEMSNSTKHRALVNLYEFGLLDRTGKKWVLAEE